MKIISNNKKRKCFFTKTAIVMLSLLCILTVLNIVQTHFFKPFWLLSENQLLYLFSAEAQVIGCLFGLTLTAFIFFIDKFKEEDEDSKSLVFDAIIQLRTKYFNNLIVIAIINGTTILSCFIGIVFLNHDSDALSFFINESLILGGIGLLYIILFTISMLDPDKKNREIKKITNKTTKEQTAISHNIPKGDLNSFLRSYNQIEKTCSEWSEYCIEKKQTLQSFKGVVHNGMVYSLRVLSRCELFDWELQNEIDKLRTLRNVAVHSTNDIFISKNQCDRVELISSVLTDAFEKFKKEMEKNPEADIYDVSDKIRDSIRSAL